MEKDSKIELGDTVRLFRDSEIDFENREIFRNFKYGIVVDVDISRAFLSIYSIKNKDCGMWSEHFIKCSRIIFIEKHVNRRRDKNL